MDAIHNGPLNRIKLYFPSFSDQMYFPDQMYLTIFSDTLKMVDIFFYYRCCENLFCEVGFSGIFTPRPFISESVKLAVDSRENAVFFNTLAFLRNNFFFSNLMEFKRKGWLLFYDVDPFLKNFVRYFPRM